MVLLPEGYKFFEVPCGSGQNMAYIRPASIAGPDGIRPVRKRDGSLLAKIDNHFYFSVETMQVARLVVHGVCRKPNAIEADRSHRIPF